MNASDYFAFCFSLTLSFAFMRFLTRDLSCNSTRRALHCNVCLILMISCGQYKAIKHLDLVSVVLVTRGCLHALQFGFLNKSEMLFQRNKIIDGKIVSHGN